MIPFNLIDRARAIRIEDLLAQWGKGLPGKKIKRNGPCPACGGTDRFSINTKKQVWFCRPCDKGGGVIELVMNVDGVGFREAVEKLCGGKIEQKPSTKSEHSKSSDGYELEQARKAQWLWLQRCPITNSPAERYLREARGYAGSLPATLGFLPPAKPEHRPAMISAFAVAGESEPGILDEPCRVRSVHLTLLAPDGAGKADVKPNKLIVGSPRGLPIVLAPPNDLLGLAVTEGVEDALSVHQATGLGAWAAGSATFMPALADAVPGYVECVTIYAHGDPAGRNGARKLAEALTHRGIEVFVEGVGGAR